MYEKQEKNMCGPIDDHVEDSKYLYISRLPHQELFKPARFPNSAELRPSLALENMVALNPVNHQFSP